MAHLGGERRGAGFQPDYPHTLLPHDEQRRAFAQLKEFEERRTRVRQQRSPLSGTGGAEIGALQCQLRMTRV